MTMLATFNTHLESRLMVWFLTNLKFHEQIMRLLKSHLEQWNIKARLYIKEICKVTPSLKILGKHRVSQGLTTLIIQLLNSGLIEHWGVGDVGVVGLFHELIRLGGRGGMNFFQNKHWGYLGWGVWLEAIFFITKISPND